MTNSSWVLNSATLKTAPEAKPVAKDEVEVPEPIKKQLTGVTVEPQAESIDAAWDRYFAEQASLEEEAKVAHDSQVRYTVRLRMMQASRLHQPIIAKKPKPWLMNRFVMMAAIRNEQSQFWMYEGLGLAMQANHAPIEEVERALMSAVDYGNDEESLLAAGIYMSEVGLHKRALQVLQDVSEVNPYRLSLCGGLALAKRLGDLEAIKWASVGVLSQAWTNEQRHVEFDAQRTAEAVMLQLKQAGLMEQAKSFGENLSVQHIGIVGSLYAGRGMQILICLAGANSTVCSLQNGRTAGGVLLENQFSCRSTAS